MDLPSGWLSCSLIDVNEVIAGQSPESQYYNQDGIGLPFFQGKTDFGTVFPTNRVYCTKPKKTALPGDVLLSVRAPVGPTNLAREEVGIGRGINAIRPLGGISSWFILYFLRSIEPILSGSGTGTTFKAVTVDQVRSLHLPLPPLAEQHRIVEKIDALFSELDKGVEYLQTVKQQLKIYRQAVLKWAFEGKLTEEWRKDNPVQSAQSVWDKAMSIRRAETNHSAVQSINPEFDLYLLPPQWQWVSVGSISKGVEYGTAAKSSKEGDVAVLRMGNIQNCTFVYDDLVYTSDEDEIEKYRLYPGDVLFNRTNSAELVGKTAIYTGTIPAIFAGYLIRLNQISYINPKYLNYYLNSPHARLCGKKVKTDGVNQSNISGTKLSSYPFPLCSLEEQNAVVAEIESRLSVCDKLEQLVDEAMGKANSLRQSILKKAFEGRLVPQDPNDDPAEKLLERIKAERAIQKLPSKRRRKNA